jgi:hypothetical protein
MPETFRVTLRDADGFEGFDSREFDLPLGSSFPIGRASKNTTKKDLMPAPHNAYIDSPVISREHALLSANADHGAPQVFISDTGSMHGTIVNGQRLTANTPKQLSSGDMLQFGIDVNRNEEFFVARKYTFEARLARPQVPFSLGFTVPDSEEEEISSTTPRHGSQSHPLTIDESDSGSDVSDKEHADITLMRERFIADDDDDNEPVAVDSHIDNDAYPDSAVVAAFAEENYSENEGSTGYYSSDRQEDDLGDDFDSEASIMSDLEVDYISDQEVSDIKVVHTDVAVPEPNQPFSALEQADGLSHPNFPSRDIFNPNATYDAMQSLSSSELPPMSMLRQTFDSNVFTNSFPPPLPPRPSVARSPLFDRLEPAPANKQGWFLDEMPSLPNFLGANHSEHPSLFNHVPVPCMTPAQETDTPALGLGGNSPSYSPIANRIQTPPPMPTSDVTNSTPPPPSRRTKVSITEIVEEQPPTPTSVNSMKRKASVLEEDEVAVIKEPIVTPREETESSDQSTVNDIAAQTAAIIAQRPKKQPRSILSKVRNTATYIGYGAVGAASAVALLSYLPDAFFV